MNFKKIILNANAKLENKFNGLSKISANMLIFGQFLIVIILAAVLFYANRLPPDSRILLDIYKSVRLVFEDAAAGIFIL